jgi:hypothetical protein
MKQFACVCVSVNQKTWRHVSDTEVIMSIREARNLAQNLKRKYREEGVVARVSVKQLETNSLEEAIDKLIHLGRLDRVANLAKKESNNGK